MAENSSSGQRNSVWPSTTKSRAPVPVRGQTGFPKTERAQKRQQSAKGQHPEDAPPVHSQKNPAAQNRGQNRRQHHHGLHPGNHLLKRPTTQHVLHYGQRHGADRAAAQGLQGAPAQERDNGAGQRNRHTGKHVDQTAAQQHGPPAVLVAERPPDQHGQGKDEQKTAHAQAGFGVIGCKRGHHVRQCRQIHVGGERGKGADKGEIAYQPLVAENEDAFHAENRSRKKAGGLKRRKVGASIAQRGATCCTLARRTWSGSCLALSPSSPVGRPAGAGHLHGRYPGRGH